VDTTKKTIIVFSGDFDKAMAAFIIANGAAAMGDDVTMFFTFWGLNLLRKPKRVKVPGKKTFLQTMFGNMMPRGVDKIPLSKMNFAGLGVPLMKKVMKSQGAMMMDELLAAALENGVKLVACTLSMEILGFQKEEMIDEVSDYVGVAAYLLEADEANINLFI
jgi:peroxiredoxin family protein